MHSPCKQRLQPRQRLLNMQQLLSNNSSSKTGGNAGDTPDADDAAQNWPGCFRHVARCRRLNKEEVVLILSDPLKFGLVRTDVLPAEGISNGTVYLCSKVRSSQKEKNCNKKKSHFLGGLWMPRLQWLKAMARR